MAPRTVNAELVPSRAVAPAVVESPIGDRAVARWRRMPQPQLDEEHAQLLVAYLIASFPGHYVSPETEDVLRRRFVGRHQSDVLFAIDRLAETELKVSVKQLLALMGDFRTIRQEREAEAEERRRPKPPPPPPSLRARMIMEGEVIKAITRCRRAEGRDTDDKALDDLVIELRSLSGEQLAEKQAFWVAEEDKLDPGPIARLVADEARRDNDPEVWARYREILDEARKPKPETEAGARG